MTETDVKGDYEKLQKKYRLPDYEYINSDFEISSIEQKKFLLREIRRKMFNKFDGIKELLELIILPDTNSFSSMYETKLFDEEEKNQIYNIYRTLMMIDRLATIVNLKSNEKEDAEFILNALEEWKKIKIQLLPFLEKLKNNWMKETTVKEDLGYFG